MNYLVKYLDKYNGGKVFHYFDNQKDYEKFVDELNHIISEVEADEKELKRRETWRDLTDYDYRNQYTTTLPVKMEEMLDKFDIDNAVDREVESLSNKETLEVDGMEIEIRFSDEEE